MQEADDDIDLDSFFGEDKEQQVKPGPQSEPPKAPTATTVAATNGQPHTPQSEDDQIADMVKWLHIIHGDSPAVELRAPKCVDPGRTYKYTRCGYFDPEHFETMARRALHISRKLSPGVYMTLNPVMADLLAKFNNREDQSDHSTSDKQIVKRRWILFDFDPIRVEGISSTEEEKNHALAMAKSIFNFLKELGWPGPISADSGNGYHLLYRIDLPTDDNGLVEKCLKAVAAQFDNQFVKVDTSVYNPSRICKFYGTWSRKGENVKSRPWRRSYIRFIPPEIQVVPQALIESLAATAPATQTNPSSSQSSSFRLSFGQASQSLLARIANYMAKVPGGVSGEKGHNALLKVANTLVHRFALSESEALPFLVEHNKNCQPPWPEDELTRKMAEAKQKPKGTYGELRGDDDKEEEKKKKPKRKKKKSSLMKLAESQLKVEAELESEAKATETIGLATAATELPTTDANATTDEYESPPPPDNPNNTNDDSSDDSDDDSDPDDDANLICNESDRGNGRLLAQQHGDKIRYVYPWKNFIYYDGQRWKQNRAAVEMLAKYVADYLWSEAVKSMDQEQLDFAARAASERSLSAILKVARSEPGIPVEPEQLDSDPYLFNCINGTVDLRTGKLLPHSKSDLITKLCPVAYDPDAPSYTFDKFFEAIMGHDQSVIDFMQRLIGSSLTGDTRDQFIAILWGGGSNGKSTFFNAIMDTIGKDYAIRLGKEALIVKKQEGHSTERMDLFGKRLAVCSEFADGNRLDESFIKDLSGGDKIRGRRMREDSWEFDATHHLFIPTNHKPIIRGTDHGVWRRIGLIPFTVEFWDADKGQSGPPELQADKTIPATLRQEAPGILAWMVRGCIEWQRRGLDVPASVQAATGEYRAGQDILGSFLIDCCLISQGLRVRASTIYDRYKRWMDQAGEPHTPSQRRFGEAMSERKFKRETSNGIWYVGITTRDEMSQDSSDSQNSTQTESPQVDENTPWPI